MWLKKNLKKKKKKKKTSKAKLDFIVLIKTMTAREGEKKKKNQNKLQNKSKYKNNKCFSWVSAVSILSLSGSQSSPCLPRMPSNTVLVSGSAMGAAQTLIWSYSCMFLLPMYTAIRTSVFSFVGALSVLLYNP